MFDLVRFSKGMVGDREIVSICSVCNKLQDQLSGEWISISPPVYVELSHSYCPLCSEAEMTKICAMFS